MQVAGQNEQLHDLVFSYLVPQDRGPALQVMPMSANVSLAQEREHLSKSHNTFALISLNKVLSTDLLSSISHNDSTCFQEDTLQSLAAACSRVQTL